MELYDKLLCIETSSFTFKYIASYRYTSMVSRLQTLCEQAVSCCSVSAQNTLLIVLEQHVAICDILKNFRPLSARDRSNHPRTYPPGLFELSFDQFFGLPGSRGRARRIAPLHGPGAHERGNPSILTPTPPGSSTTCSKNNSNNPGG
jgi:hypothetical protein